MDDWLERERLHFAAGEGNLAAVQSLVNKGRDVNSKDSDLGLTPLHYAAAGEHIDVVRFLIANGADVNAIDEATAGDTPLGHVAQECSFPMAKTLLDAGANPLIPGMEEFAGSLEAGEDITERFSCHKVVLDLQPTSYDKDLVKKTRKMLGASQAILARFLGVSVSAICSWEQGLKEPSETACRFMDEIRRDPEHWRERLRQSVRLKTAKA